MKKSFGLFALFVILLSSCQTITKTARTADIGTSLQSATIADLEVDDQRITHTMSPSKEIQRGGLNNIKQAVEYEALNKYGNADILLEPQYVISKKQTLFRSKITSISVSGRPARYKNFRSLHDSVWCNPVFRGVNETKRIVKTKRFLGNRSTKNELSYRTKGFTGYITPFLGSGTFYDHYEYEDVETSTLAALISVGYQLTPRIYLGIGTGYDYVVDGDSYMPLFINPRLYLSKKQNSLFIDCKLGYGFNFEEDKTTLTGLALGYSFGKMDLAIEYLYQERSGDYWDEDYELDEIGVSIGFRF